MTSVLENIIEKQQTRIARMETAIPIEQMKIKALSSPPAKDFTTMIRMRRKDGQPAIIAEYKRASPSAGLIRAELSVEDVVQSYDAHGAAAISILTEETFFRGDINFLTRARQMTSLPLLCKDFVISPYQVYLARAHQADALLLIMSILDEPRSMSLLKLIHELGMEALIEVHNKAELNQAKELNAPLIGVNNRNLHTMQTDIRTSLTLIEDIPATATKVSESGIHSRTDLAALRTAGYDAVLIGEHLMRSPDPGMALEKLISSDSDGETNDKN